MGEITATLSGYAEQTRFDALPSDVVRMAKDVVLDQLGCQLGCSLLPHARMAIDFARTHPGPTEATVVGTDLMTSIDHAAFVNGILGHGDEIDGSLPGFGHAGAALLPTVLAVGEWRHASGRDLITALVVGYDVARRLARAGLDLDRLSPRNFHQSSVAGSLVTAVAAGRLLGLDRLQHQAALGLAAEQAGGLMAMRAESAHMNKSFHFGVAARNGVVAASMAQFGYGGVLDVLDPPLSIFDAFLPDGSEPGQVVEELGTRYDILEARFKRYASGSPTHSAIAVLHQIMEDHRLGADDIASIEARMPSVEQGLLSKRATLNVNAEYVLAVAAVDGRVSWEQFDDAHQRDSIVRSMVERVRSVGDAEMDILKDSDPLARPAEVTVTTRGGERLTGRMIYPPGSPKNPLSREELREKFDYWSTRVLAERQALALRERIDALEDVDDVGEIGELLRSR